MWATLRKSLSSEAAESLSIAFTRAASVTGSRAPSNHTAASRLPPCSLARSRTMPADPIDEPDAPLASVLARIILACLIDAGGRSPKLTLFRMRASVRALAGDFPSAAAAAGQTVAMPAIPANEPCKSRRRSSCNVSPANQLSSRFRWCSIGESPQAAMVSCSYWIEFTARQRRNTADLHEASGVASRKFATWNACGADAGSAIHNEAGDRPTSRLLQPTRRFMTIGKSLCSRVRPLTTKKFTNHVNSMKSRVRLSSAARGRSATSVPATAVFRQFQWRGVGSSRQAQPHHILDANRKCRRARDNPG